MASVAGRSAGAPAAHQPTHLQILPPIARVRSSPLAALPVRPAPREIGAEPEQPHRNRPTHAIPRRARRHHHTSPRPTIASTTPTNSNALLESPRTCSTIGSKVPHRALPAADGRTGPRTSGLPRGGFAHRGLFGSARRARRSGFRFSGSISSRRAPRIDRFYASSTMRSDWTAPADALLVAARRLNADPVGIVFAATPFRSGITIEDFQLERLVRALWSPRTTLLFSATRLCRPTLMQSALLLLRPCRC
jgi:hypothetical protein